MGHVLGCGIPHLVVIHSQRRVSPEHLKGEAHGKGTHNTGVPRRAPPVQDSSGVLLGFRSVGVKEGEEAGAEKTALGGTEQRSKERVGVEPSQTDSIDGRGFETKFHSV